MLNIVKFILTNLFTHTMPPFFSFFAKYFMGLFFVFLFVRASMVVLVCVFHCYHWWVALNLWFIGTLWTSIFVCVVPRLGSAINPYTLHHFVFKLDWLWCLIQKMSDIKIIFLKSINRILGTKCGIWQRPTAQMSGQQEVKLLHTS